MPSAKLLKNNRITLPKEVRQALNLKEGDIVELEIRESCAEMRAKNSAEKESVFASWPLGAKGKLTREAIYEDQTKQDKEKENQT